MQGRPNKIEPELREIYKGRTKLKEVRWFLQKVPFLSYEEAQKVARSAGIKNIREYRLAKKRLNLPACPDQAYRGFWKGMKPFLGTGNAPLSWPSYAEARNIVRRAGIKSGPQYQAKRRSLGLPALAFYCNCKTGCRSYDFFGTQPKKWPWGEHRVTFLGARKRVRAAHIKSVKEYKKRHRSLILPPDPRETYKTNWTGWDRFFGIQRHISYLKARRLVRTLRITTQRDYIRVSKKFNFPPILYLKKKRAHKGWKGWHEFSTWPSNQKPINGWPLYQEIERIVRKAKIKSIRQYDANHCSLGLPSASTLVKLHPKHWRGFRELFGTEIVRRSFSEARRLVQRLGILSATEYRQRYKEVRGLPSNPSLTYRNEWKGFKFFAGIDVALSKEFWRMKGAGCHICCHHHKLRQQLDADISAGIAIRFLQQTYGLSRSALYRHKYHIIDHQKKAA